MLEIAPRNSNRIPGGTAEIRALHCSYEVGDEESYKRALTFLIGAIGVSGAPGGDKDEACANAGLAKISDRLN